MLGPAVPRPGVVVDVRDAGPEVDVGVAHRSSGGGLEYAPDCPVGQLVGAVILNTTDMGGDVGLELGGEFPGHLGEDRARRSPNVLGASLGFLPEAPGKASVVLYPHWHPLSCLQPPGPPHVPELAPSQSPAPTERAAPPGDYSGLTVVIA